MTTSPDPAFIEEAVARFEGPLVRYAARLTGDLERARDIVQDTFLKLCRQDRAAVDGHLAEWLYTVCRHGAVDVLRKESRMHSSPDVAATLATGPEGDPGARLQHSEAHGRILRWMESLPASQQEVLRLKFGAGLSYAEIARVTERTVNHVGVLLHHGLKTLRARAAVVAPTPPAGRSSR